MTKEDTKGQHRKSGLPRIVTQKTFHRFLTALVVIALAYVAGVVISESGKNDEVVNSSSVTPESRYAPKIEVVMPPQEDQHDEKVVIGDYIEKAEKKRQRQERLRKKRAQERRERLQAQRVSRAAKRRAAQEVQVAGAQEHVHEPEPAPAPAPPAPPGISAEPCRLGSTIESGLVHNSIAVYRAVCAAFPSITTYGGYRNDPGSYHGTGQAVDIMVSGDAGWAVANFLLDNRSALGVHELIYQQKIWTTERASEGWRWMEDRGSTTANHYDHVHVSVF